MPTLYVGLGPRGREVTKNDLGSRFDTICKVRDIRMRGATAFVDVETENDADRLVDAFNGTFIGEIRLVVERSKIDPSQPPAPRERGRRLEKRQRSRTPERRRRSRSRSRTPERRRGDEMQTLFVGLGPFARDISDREIIDRLEDAAPVIRLRRRGLSIFADVRNRSDAQRVMDKLNNTFIGKARVTVQPSRETRPLDDRYPVRERRERRGRSRSRTPLSSRSYSSRSSSSRDSRRHRHRRHRRESGGRHRSSRRRRSPSDSPSRSRSRSPSGSRRSESSRSHGSRSASARSSISRH